MPEAPRAAPRFLDRALRNIEHIGNALPQPATLFASLALAVILLSAIAEAAGLAVTNPANGDTIPAISLLNVEGFHLILTQTLSNFINFPPLGVVMVCLLGIAVAEHTGLIGACVRLLVLTAPRTWVTPMIVFAGIMSNAGGDVGYVLLIPLSAAIFHSLGRHPLAGLAAAFAGVSGGFSANLLVGTIDVLLSGLSQAAAQLVQPGYTVTGFANYYFMVAATFVVTFVGTWVTHRIVEPRLGTYTGDHPPEPLHPLSAAEKRGIVFTALFAAATIAIILAGLLPANGFLRNPAHTTYPDAILQSHFLRNLVPFIFFVGVGSGIAYGIGAKSIQSDRDVVKGMEKSMGTLGSYLVLAFFAAQFIAYFKWTNLGLIIAVEGASLLQSLGLDDQPIPLMIGLILLSACINLVLGSASAKWALLAPIFVPMFMLLGYSPELVQAAYRVGDSTTNIITPLMSFFPLIISFVRRYDPSTGMGTLIATMLPYSAALLIGWSVLLVAWLLLGLPVGPDAPLYIDR